MHCYIGLLPEAPALVIPFFILALLALGIFFPVSDYVRKCKQAKAKGQEVPNKQMITHDLKTSPFLGMFLGILGFVTCLLAMAPFFDMANLSLIDIVYVLGGLIAGTLLMVRGKKMVDSSI